MKRYKLFIDGRYVDPVRLEWFDTVNPYTGEVWARIPRATKEDVDIAVAAASRALKAGPWAMMTATARGKLMRRLGDLVLENAQRLAETEVRDNGKVMTEVLNQLRSQSEWWWYFSGLADKIEGAVVPLDRSDAFAFTTHEPVGVVGALTAWNSPLLFVAMKCAPALAAGCTVVLKPSEFASASTLEFMELTQHAGFPSGVFNVVTGFGPETGAALVEHPDVAKVSFTGSDATGAKVYAAAAKSMKRVSMELGGKSPNIVFEDCDFAQAVSGVVSGIFAATGQACVAGSRLLVQNSIKDLFVDQLVSMVALARIGDPNAPENSIGPLATPEQYKKVLRYIDIAKSEGARCVIGGEAMRDLSGGQFVQPTVFIDVKSDMRIAQEEVFGPVLSVMGFDDEADAVRIANDVIYGLAAGVWTADISKAFRVSKALRVGTVWINAYRAMSFNLPFGGMKQSGIGRENGIEAVREFLETKSVWVSTKAGTPAKKVSANMQ